MTPGQHKAFTFVRDQIAETGICPTLAEIADAMGVFSRSNASRVVDALIRDGYLLRGGRGTRRNLRVATDSLVHIPTSVLMAELERRGVSLG